MQQAIELRNNIFEQPEALRRLASFYHTREGRDLLATIPRAHHPVFTGMGASYHAGLIASYHLQAQKFASSAIEAVDLLHYSQLPGMLACLISQSGASGEISPLVEQLKDNAFLVGITNHPESIL